MSSGARQRRAPRPLRAVLYDFDGTLVDSAESSFQCYVRTFERFGIPFDHQTFARTYSPNWLHTYAAVGLPREQWDEADQIWLDLYAQMECQIIVGVRDAMRRFSEHGLLQGIVTSGSRSRVLADLELLGLSQFVQAVVCSGDVMKKKPHPEGLFRGLDLLQVHPETAAYVGDSPEDVQMAREAGVFAVAIPGKYPNQEALLAAGADLFANSLNEAAAVLLDHTPSS